MIRVTLIVFISLCCGPFITTNGQASRSDQSDVLKQLLDKPAPRPPSKREQDTRVSERPRSFYDRDKPPSDDAPIEDLIDYWSRWNDQSGPRASDAVRQRLLEAVSEPGTLVNLIDVLPQTEAAAARVKQVYDKVQNDEKSNEYFRLKLKGWLIYNTNLFLDELLALATTVRDHEKSGTVDNDQALVALAKINWESAEPLLRNLLASGQPRSAALAQSLFYKHAVEQKDSAAEERYRNTLKEIASNRNQPPYARDRAIETLWAGEWSGRDEWYLSLFQDESLIGLSSGVNSFSPLVNIFSADPDKWIPIMMRLVESKDVTVRSSAVECLINLPFNRLPREVLLSLLPWLSNPKWVDERIPGRSTLIQAMGFVDVPESVPGLIWTVETDTDEFAFDRSYAASALAKYKDPRAIPALKKALTKENEETRRQAIIHGLIGCQGFTDAEQLEALEAYATKLTTTGPEEVEHWTRSGKGPLPTSISVGRYLSRLNVAPESLVQLVFTRADKLKSSNPPLAKTLLEIAHRWRGRQVDVDMINRIGNGSADTNTIIQALQRRVKLRETAGPELHALTAVSGSAQGVAAVLLEDASLAHAVLSSEDQLAQIALLACSRLTRAPLPVELVGRLLSSKNSLLTLAAKSYLLNEDSKEARELLWKRYPDQAFVTGWGENAEIEPYHYALGRVEEKLRAELFKENAPVEIIALIRFEHTNAVLRVYPDKAIYTSYEDSVRYVERTVPQAELASFKEFLAMKGIADLGPQFEWCDHDCWGAEFLTLTKQKGRRVYSVQGSDAWSDVKLRFDRLGRGDGAKTRYNLEKEIKGLEVLYADEELMVKDVWQQGNEVRIFVEREETDEETKERTQSDSPRDNDEASRVDRWRKEVALRNARFSWRVYANNKAEGVTSQPDVYSTIDESKFPPGETGGAFLRDDPDARKLSADSIIIAREFDGLWKQVAGSKAVRISNGGYKGPVVTPDGKWVVVSKSDDEWEGPNYVVRFNLQTGREFRVKLEAADDFGAVAFIPPHGKVLLRRAKEVSDRPRRTSVGPEHPEYYLLDPATGETRAVTGEFEPLDQAGDRFLQRTENANEFWVAMPDTTKNQTRVGRYNLKDFTFKAMMTIPQISFDSMAMWVDEQRKQIYFVFKNQLLRLPLVNHD